MTIPARQLELVYKVLLGSGAPDGRASSFLASRPILALYGRGL